MSFWEVHGVVGGFFFIAFLLLLPRLTLLFSVSLWAIISQTITETLGLAGYTGWGLTFTLSLVAWGAWVVVPRYVIAVAATLLYWKTNYVLCIFACFIAYFVFETAKIAFREVVKGARKKAEEIRREREGVQEEIRKTEEAIRRMQERTQARDRSTKSAEELLENIRRFQEHVRAQQERARRANSVRARASNWWDVLGVSKDASADAIKAAYRKIAKNTHPDTAPEGAADPDRFNEATEAYKQAPKK